MLVEKKGDRVMGLSWLKELTTKEAWSLSIIKTVVNRLWRVMAARIWTKCKMDSRNRDLMHHLEGA